MWRPVFSGVDGGVVPMVPPPSLPLPLPPPVVVVQPGLPAVPVDAGGTGPSIAYVGGVPSNVMAAYQNAAALLARTQPNCHLPVELLAAIGKVESGHARGGRLDAAGTAVPSILGPVLDGSGGFAAIPDTDHGALDGDSTWDRAVGPMQFIPSTWRRWASDGNNDGVADPENIYDATLAAGRYLCADGRDLSTDVGIQSAILSYNDSVAYLHLVSAWLAAYHGGMTQVADVRTLASPVTSTAAPPASSTVSAPPTIAAAPTTTPAPTTIPTPTGTGPVPSVPPTGPVGTTPPTTTAPPVVLPPPLGSVLCDLQGTLGGLLGGLLGLGAPPPCPADNAQPQPTTGP
ncbi:MAG TPA: lytic murein transglycosylase [Pseudonocardiaceae bacterium]|nr:lytic murein transglycosylase [Pseudonocardiaceae bacterium]